jgi:hypothetical protein
LWKSGSSQDAPKKNTLHSLLKPFAGHSPYLILFVVRHRGNPSVFLG